MEKMKNKKSNLVVNFSDEVFLFTPLVASQRKTVSVPRGNFIKGARNE
jgi:hypothetical protein